MYIFKNILVYVENNNLDLTKYFYCHFMLLHNNVSKKIFLFQSKSNAIKWYKSMKYGGKKVQAWKIRASVIKSQKKIQWK